MRKAIILLALVFAVTGNASAATQIFTGPVRTQPAATSPTGVRVSCDVLNLSKKIQNVTAELVSNDGTVVQTSTAAVQPGQGTYRLATNYGGNGYFFCRFTIDSAKVRGYIVLTNQDFSFQFSEEAHYCI